MEVSVSIVGIAIAGICLIHIIIAIGCLHHRWVVYIGKIPVGTLIPTRHAHIVIHVGWTDVFRQLVLQGLGRSRKLLLLCIDQVVTDQCIRLHIIGGVRLQVTEGGREVTCHLAERRIVYRWLGGSTVAETLLDEVLHTSRRQLSRQACRSRSHLTYREIADRGSVVYLVIVAAAYNE